MLKIFPALRNRNYRLYFIGMAVSMTGTWLQVVAQGWLVMKLVNSAFLVGMVAAAATLPGMLFMLFGGVIVDRFQKRKILIITQASAMVLAFILGALTIANVITVSLIIFIAFLLGCVNAVDTPARQSIMVELVGKEDLQSAIALNATVMNGSRVVGPALAGFLITLIGIGGTFILNGISFLAVLIALFYINSKSARHEVHSRPLTAIKHGLIYAWNNYSVRILIFYCAAISIFGWSYTTMLPVIAQNIFHIDATGLGYLYSASGIGAVVGAVFLSIFSKKFKSSTFVLAGNAVFAISIFLFTLSSNFIVALFFLFTASYGLAFIFATLNNLIQQMIDDKFRGRVVSIFMLAFIGSAPIGSFQIGYFSELYGTGMGLRIGATITLLAGALLFLYRKRIFAQTAPSLATADVR